MVIEALGDMSNRIAEIAGYIDELILSQPTGNAVDFKPIINNIDFVKIANTRGKFIIDALAHNGYSLEYRWNVDRKDGSLIYKNEGDWFFDAKGTGEYFIWLIVLSDCGFFYRTQLKITATENNIFKSLRRN